MRFFSPFPFLFKVTERGGGCKMMKQKRLLASAHHVALDIDFGSIKHISMFPSLAHC